MFLTARVLFLNEEDYIWYVLKSMYDAVDAIVIVEGCIGEYGRIEGFYSKSGLSIDRSSEEIERFIANDDPDGKVWNYKYGFAKNYAELANHAVDLFPRETTHFLNVDADECYKALDILRVRQMFSDHPRLCGVAVDRIHFYLDFWTRRISKKMGKLEPTGGTMFRKFYPGEYYPEKSAEHNPYFEGEPLINWWLPWIAQDDIETGIKDAQEQGLDGITLRKRVIPQYHYGWVRKREKMIERVLQTYRRSDAYSGLNVRAESSDQELTEFIETYNPIWTGILPDEDVLQKFPPSKVNRIRCDQILWEAVGEHPLPMKDHPFFGMQRRDFGWL